MTSPENLAVEDYMRSLEAVSEPLVTVERPRDGVAVVRLDNPDNKNALDGPLTVQLRRHLAAALADYDIRIVVLTGTGSFFSAGGDWKLMKERAHTYAARDEGLYGIWHWIRNEFGGIARLITQTDKTVIAQVNGHAAGVALAWVLNCDLIAVAEDAMLVTAFGRIGLVPEVGTNWQLARRLGHQRAFELFVEGKPLSGSEAADLGLVNKAVPKDALDETVGKWCERILSLPSHVVPMAKPLMRNAADMSWQQAIMAEEFAEPATFTTKAHQEIIDALLAKEQKALG